MGPSPHVHFPVIIPQHYTPIYFPGLNHDISFVILGSLQFKVRLEAIKSFASFAIITVRHGLSKGIFVLTLSPFGQGAKSQF